MSLDPHPTARQLRAMAKRKGIAVAQNAATKRGKAPSTRPWHPFRSKWEAEYAKHLEMLKRCGLIESWDYEPDHLDIGIGATFTPDFRVRNVRGEKEYHEVKGYRREAAMVRLRVAAKLFTASTFILVTKRGTEWHHQIMTAQPLPLTPLAR